VGYGPKFLARVLRFHRFLTSAAEVPQSPAPLAALAWAASYADQAHMTHECRELAGLTPRELIDGWAS